MSSNHRFRRGLSRFRTAITASFARAGETKTRCTLPRAPASVSSLPDYEYDDNDDIISIADSVQEVNMGKSNTFDFTNKHSTGVGCGAFVRKQLEKEAEKVLKNADKQTAKARKASASSAASGASSVDAQEAIFHALDLKIPNKELGDAGALEVAQGLMNALQKGTSQAGVLLEDLNLTGNGLTTMSLEQLAPIIKLAKHDLKTLNLSNNSIKVDTAEEAAQWETFLRAFVGCFKLRRLDLSGNVNLGAKALEVLAHVHIQEDAIDPMSASGEASVVSLAEEVDGGQPTPKASHFTDSMTGGKHLRRRRGLRSIPFISLTNIGLTDAGALWLSYVLEDHHYPSQLIDSLNATLASSTIGAYQQETNSRGIDWNEREETLGKDGLYLLKKAETVRKQAMLADQVTVACSMLTNETGADGENEEADSASRRSLDRRHSRAARGDRRASVRSIRTADGAESDVVELDSARKRVQRTVIGKQTAESVELWHAGLRVFICCRTLVRLGPISRNPVAIYTGPPMFDFTKRMSNKPRQKSSSRPVTPISRKQDENRRPSDSGQSSPGVSLAKKQGSYAATLTANTSATAGEPELVITDVTNSPTTPKLVFKPHRKGAFSEGCDSQTANQKPAQGQSSDLGAVTKKLDALIVRDDNPQRFVTWQAKHMPDNPDGPNAFRNSGVPSHLPNKPMEHIAKVMITDRERKLLSEKQFHDACTWGLNLDNVEVEKEWRKEAKSSQMWRLLEAIGCLEYQQRE